VETIEEEEKVWTRWKLEIYMSFICRLFDICDICVLVNHCSLYICIFLYLLINFHKVLVLKIWYCLFVTSGICLL
jgi:hypothetical protein